MLHGSISSMVRATDMFAGSNPAPLKKDSQVVQGKALRMLQQKRRWSLLYQRPQQQKLLSGIGFGK